MTVKPEKTASIIASARILLLPTILSETDFIYSTKESENKDAECVFCNGKFSEDEQGEIWIVFLLDFTGAENAEMTFMNKFEA